MSDPYTQVRIENVFKRFGETVALNGCSLTIEPGKVHAIVGENGSGKSTLTKIMAGVLRPDSGNVSVFGETPRDPMHARSLGVAMIFQEVLVAEKLTVVDNIFAGMDTLWRRSRSRAESRSQSREILKRFSGVDIDPDTPVEHLPLSIKQWIVIARALLSKPRLLILDESSAALDLDATARLHEEIHKLRQAGCCIAIVTHRIAELVRIADHATVLRDGTVVGELAGVEITEKNLLKLMSSRSIPVDTETQVTATPARNFTDAAMSAAGLRLEQGAKPFEFGLFAGEIVGVTGLDGQGHADFIRAMAGLTNPVTGSITASGNGRAEIVPANARLPGVAYVSGDRAHEGIFPNLSIFENFALPLYQRSGGMVGWITRRPLERAFEKEVLRLSIKAGSPANLITSLSGGNQQKVLIGRAFAANPKVIVLDDPARGVDIGTKRELYAQLKSFAGQGGAVIYLSSEIEDFFDFADRVVIFRDKTLFRTIPATRFSEHSFLAAMFGEPEGTTMSFETAGGA